MAVSCPTTDCPAATGSGEHGAGGCCLHSPASCLLICHAPPGFLCCLLLFHLVPAGCCCCLVAKSCPTLVTPWTTHQAPLSMGLLRRECWSELPFPSPGDLPSLRIEPIFPPLPVDSLPLSHWGMNQPIHLVRALCLKLCGGEGERARHPEFGKPPTVQGERERDNCSDSSPT